jgi:hypothetical protein
MPPEKANGMGETNVFPAKFATAEKEPTGSPSRDIFQLLKEIESPPLLAVTTACAPLHVNVSAMPNVLEVAVTLTFKPV